MTTVKCSKCGYPAYPATSKATGLKVYVCEHEHLTEGVQTIEDVREWLSCLGGDFGAEGDPLTIQAEARVALAVLDEFLNGSVAVWRELAKMEEFTNVVDEIAAGRLTITGRFPTEPELQNLPAPRRNG